MRDNCHTVILKCDRCPLPSEEGIREFILGSLASAKTEVEYFGCELDSAWDYVDESLKTEILSACYITLQFEDENAPDYHTDKQEIKKFMFNYFDENNSKIIIDSEGKDVDVYFN